jgi:hypothetical protein
MHIVNTNKYSNREKSKKNDDLGLRTHAKYLVVYVCRMFT